MFGKLSLAAIPYENPIIMGAVGGSILLAALILALITYYRKWTYLWQEWLTSLDHKRIGIMYIVLALVMLLRGFSDAILMRIATGGPDTSLDQSILLFIKEAFGGILIGLVIGWMAYQMLKRVDNYQVEVLITLGLVMGGYDLAHALHTSGPLAIVAAGLLIGNHGRAFAMSETTRKNLDMFWELIDEILNGILFILIGIEVLVLEISFHHFPAGLVIIPLVLLVRLVSVGIPFGLLGQRIPSRTNAVKTLTWGGLRGGIAVALALSIPQVPQRGIIVFITYMVVIFSIVVQGLTIKKMLKRWGV
jgi:monovalent cation:H+ antiporter, CPA1 family